MLLQAVADEWGVAATELTTAPNVVVHSASTQRISYGEITRFANMPEHMPEVTEGDFKKPDQYRLIGNSQPRRDIPAKVDGTALFAIDVNFPEMFYATTVHSPVHGAKPETWNESEILAMQGISATVKLPAGIAIVGDSFVNVMVARKALTVNWSALQARGYDSETALQESYEKLHADPTSPSTPVSLSISILKSVTLRYRQLSQGRFSG